jgi:hypothetical protein
VLLSKTCRSNGEAHAPRSYLRHLLSAQMFAGLTLGQAGTNHITLGPAAHSVRR